MGSLFELEGLGGITCVMGLAHNAGLVWELKTLVLGNAGEVQGDQTRSCAKSSEKCASVCSPAFMRNRKDGECVDEGELPSASSFNSFILVSSEAA